MKSYICDLYSRKSSGKVGSKASNLRFLIRHHYPVPSGFVCTLDARTDYLLYGQPVLQAIREQLTPHISNDLTYAVRSSSNAEDQSSCSYAGQFNSFLHVKGIDHIMQAILDVWASADSPTVESYCLEKDLDMKRIEMAVIIQQMVPALHSGIAFSKNPVTGLSEIMIEAKAGAGSQPQDGDAIPFRWISKWGRWLEQPAETPIPEALITQIIGNTAEIAAKYGRAVDLEWAYDGKTLYFLQVRCITGLDIPIYSNRISKEMLPGIIKPLVWSVNTRLNNEMWVEILGRLTGEHTLSPESLTGHFFYRAYFNMALFGRVFERLGMPYESLELLLGLESEGSQKPRMHPGMKSIYLLPRMAGFAVSLSFIELRLKRLINSKNKKYRVLSSKIEREVSPEGLLSLAETLFAETRPVVYFNIMIPLIGMMYTRFFDSMLKKSGVDPRILDTSIIRQASAEYSPLHALEALHRKYFADGSYSPERNRRQFDADIQTFLSQFGHFSDSGNDLSIRPWRETPELIARMIERTVPNPGKKDQTLQFEDLKLPRGRRWLIGRVYRRTCRFAVHREALSSLYTFGYGQFRKCFVSLADRFVEQQLIADRDDIFYLYLHEVRDLLQGKDFARYNDLIRKRREEVLQVTDTPLPSVIFGSEQPPVIISDQDTLHGIPTSIGSYTGPVKVLRGLSEMDSLAEGDVLVIPYSDVGWTPLFCKAGAVIAESGGVLSHSSIVAREYHIPAVVSVADACRIPDRTVVTVNGYNGEVTFVK